MSSRLSAYTGVMRSGAAEGLPNDAPGLSGPTHGSREAAVGSPPIELLLEEEGDGESLALALAPGKALTRTETAGGNVSEGGGDHGEEGEGQGRQEVLTLSLADGAESEAPPDPVREVDRRNGNAARARKQAAKQPQVEETANGDIVRKAKGLVIPEEKRCRALTVRGERCRSGKMRGLEVCVFHAHRAASDEALTALVDTEAKPRLTPRKALKAVVALRAGELAEAAVEGALAADAQNRTRAVLALIDSVDPLLQTEESVTLSKEGAETATWKQLQAVFGS